MKETVYISGPISGIKEKNFPAFRAAAKRLRSKGYTVISPHEIELPQYPKDYIPKDAEEQREVWKAYMRADIAEMMKADMVVVLRGWSNSRGANVEVKLAMDLGMKVIELEGIE